MWKWIAGSAAVLFAGRYLSRLQTAAETITAKVSLQIRKITLGGIELKALVNIQNPNPITLAIQHPFLQLKYREQLLGSSDLVNQRIQIKPHSQESFEMTIRSAGWISLIQILGRDLSDKIRKGQAVSLHIQAITTTRVNNIPFVKEDLIQISI